MGLAVSFLTIAEMFEKLSQKFAHCDRPALMHKIDGAYCNISYRQLHDDVVDFANGLLSMGITRRDNIGLISENRPEWVVADMAIIKLGAVNVPLYPTLSSKQTEYIFNDAKVKFAIVSNQFQLNKVLQFAEMVPSLQKIIVFTDVETVDPKRVVTFKDLLKEGAEFQRNHPEHLAHASMLVKREDVLTIIYTSGTTGNPKGVMLTHRNLVANMEASASVIPFTDKDVLLSFLPLCHSYERMGGYYTAMACGATIAYAQSLDTLRENFVEVRPTVVTTVPRLFERMYRRLVKQVNAEPGFKKKLFQWSTNVGREYSQAKKKEKVSTKLAFQHFIAEKIVLHKVKERTGGRMRFFVSGGAALAPELGEFFEAVGLTILEGYGMTESSPVITVNRVDNYKFGTVGQPIPGVEVRIAHDGEILVRGENVMKGYWNDPQSTKETIDKNGWLHTGDIGVLDNDGFLTITDRKKHIFVNSGGKNIAPNHIENLFLQSEFIDQFVLIGDKRTYLTALIVPDFEALKVYARNNNISFINEKELAEKSEVRDLIQKEIERLQKDLANFERVRKFTILDRPLTVENGEITPTMKVRRKVIDDKFRHIIDKMYDDIS